MNNDINIGGNPASKNGKWVAVGRLSVEKGILKLVEKWPNELELDIFGDGPELPKIQELIKTKPNITLKGTIPGSELEQLLPRYLGAIHCSLWIEIAPLTVLEFKRAGLPIIYTGNNFTPFAMDIPIVGVKLEKYEPRYLIEACENILQNYRKASDKSHQAYLEYYSEEAWILRFESLIREVQSL
jgi:glycosyltransferase involved in cell wall biosynthesis